MCERDSTDISTHNATMPAPTCTQTCAAGCQNNGGQNQNPKIPSMEFPEKLPYDLPSPLTRMMHIIIIIMEREGSRRGGGGRIAILMGLCQLKGASKSQNPFHASHHAQRFM
eukprot:12204956-Karenia_brevis.AAC.1